MMNDKLEENLTLLRLYYVTRRQVGHTSALVNGIAATPDVILVGRDYDDAHHVEKMIGRRLRPPVVSWNAFNIDQRYMVGQKRPLVVTETALVDMLGEALGELRQQRRYIHMLEAEIRDWKELRKR